MEGTGRLEISRFVIFFPLASRSSCRIPWRIGVFMSLIDRYLWRTLLWEFYIHIFFSASLWDILAPRRTRSPNRSRVYGGSVLIVKACFFPVSVMFMDDLSDIGRIRYAEVDEVSSCVEVTPLFIWVSEVPFHRVRWNDRLSNCHSVVWNSSSPLLICSGNLAA